MSKHLVFRRFLHIRHWSIRFKLFAVFLGLVLVPFAVYTGVVLDQSARDMQAFGAYTASQVLLQTGQYIANRVETVKRAVDFFALDSSVRAIVNTDPVSYQDNFNAWNRDALTLRTMKWSLGQNNPDIATFTLYMEHGLGSTDLAEESQEFRPMAAEHPKAWYQRMAEKDRAFWWFAPGNWFEAQAVPSIHGLRRIPDELDLNNIIGYVRADIPSAIIETILDKAEFSASALAYLINSNGELVARSTRARRFTSNWCRAMATTVQPGAEGPAEALWQRLSDSGNTYLSGLVGIPQTDWRLVLLVPERDIDAFSTNTRSRLILVLCLIAPLMLPLAYAVAFTSTRRLGRLLQGLRSVESGDIQVSLLVKGQDEIDRLADNFNLMARRIKESLAREFAAGQAIKGLELRALQAQINPHFLYNTLDLINCLALDAGNREICEAVDALSRFYRLSLFGDSDIVTLAEELEHARTYLSIQNMRFGEGIVCDITVPETLLHLPVMKLLLQPLVENAVMHGIREKDDESGTISIRGWLETTSGPTVLCISVADDGVGIPSERLANLLAPERSGPASAEGHGYGVRNIDERLKLKYGSSFGLWYQSTSGQGTTVNIRMPVTHPEQDGLARQ